MGAICPLLVRKLGNLAKILWYLPIVVINRVSASTNILSRWSCVPRVALLLPPLWRDLTAGWDGGLSIIFHTSSYNNLWTLCHITYYRALITKVINYIPIMGEWSLYHYTHYTDTYSLHRVDCIHNHNVGCTKYPQNEFANFKILQRSPPRKIYSKTDMSWLPTVLL